MEILTPELLCEWVRLDPATDLATLNMLESSAIDVIELELNVPVRPYTDAVGVAVTPVVPQAVKHAIAVFISAHFDNRAGASDAALATVRNLCLPHRRWYL